VRRSIFLVGATLIGLAAVGFAELADGSQHLYYRILNYSPWLPFVLSPLGFAALATITRGISPPRQGAASRR
jgi:hypothetical protein